MKNAADWPMKAPYFCSKSVISNHLLMRLTLEIQEDKLAFFLELIRNFSFIKLDEADKLAVSEELLAIVEERLAAYEAAPDNVITWEQVRASSADEQRFVARKLLVKSMSAVDADTEVPEELITESIEAIRAKRLFLTQT